MNPYLRTLAFVVALALPAIAFSAPLVPCSGAQDCNWSALLKLGQNIMNFMILIGSSIAAIMFAVAGFTYLTSKGEPGKISAAHQMLTNVVVGYAIALAAFLLIKLVLTLANDQFKIGELK